MSNPMPRDLAAPVARPSSAALAGRDLVTALRCATIPIWLLLCVAGACLWGGYVTLGLVFLTWRAAARFG